MASLTEIAEKLGACTSEVRRARQDVQGVGSKLDGVEVRLSAVEDQLRTRRTKERLLWAVVTTLGVASWGAIGLIPWRFWAALVQALAKP